MARYKPLKNKQRQYLDTDTGQIISRYAYIKATKGASPAELAKNSRARSPLAYAARPARGRKSLLKADRVIQETVAEARLEEIKLKELAEKKLKEEKEFKRRMERQLNKKVKRKVVRKALLNPGDKGARINFNNYEEYLQALKEARTIGVVDYYGLGIVALDLETLQQRHITVFTMLTVRDTIPLDEFEEEMKTAIMERPYLEAQHFFMHLAYNIDFAAQKAERYRKRAPKKRI